MVYYYYIFFFLYRTLQLKLIPAWSQPKGILCRSMLYIQYFPSICFVDQSLIVHFENYLIFPSDSFIISFNSHWLIFVMTLIWFVGNPFCDDALYVVLPGFVELNMKYVMFAPIFSSYPRSQSFKLTDLSPSRTFK